MMVLFQNRIIYMPSMPPFSRSEKLEDYTGTWSGVTWKTEHIRSLDGTRLAICTGRIDRDDVQQRQDKCLVLYFQGNGSSTPPRTPMLSKILALAAQDSKLDVTLVALSYRGYWSSSGRPSQRGIERDSQALLQWAQQTHGHNVGLVLWGQSIGAGIATRAAAQYLEQKSDDQRLKVVGLILETPFVSVRRMLAALYPEKWVPYKYLWPFLRNWWDSEQALSDIAKVKNPPKVLLLPAEKDEVVPPAEVNYLHEVCRDVGLEVERRDVFRALHNEASSRMEGSGAIVAFMQRLSED